MADTNAATPRRSDDPTSGDRLDREVVDTAGNQGDADHSATPRKRARRAGTAVDRKSWLQSVPGFRTRRTWKKLMAGLGYLVIGRIVWIGGAAGIVFGLLALLGVAAAADAFHVRRRVPLIGARSRLGQGVGWLLYGGALFLAFLIALPTPDSTTAPDTSISSAGHGTPAGAARHSDGSRDAGAASSEAIQVNSAPRGGGAAAPPADGTAATSGRSMTDRNAKVASRVPPTTPPQAQALPSRTAPPPTAPPTRRPTVQPPSPSPAPTASALLRVMRVVDGDTLDVLRDGQRVRIRLIGIDTPETTDPRTTVECFGREAAARATELLAGKLVRIATDPSQDEHDKYGRLLAYAWLDDGTFVNRTMIAEGFANEYTYDVPYRYQAEFKAAERLAREGSIGLWSPDTCGGDTNRPAAQSRSSASGAAAPPRSPPPAEPIGAAGGVGEVIISEIYYDGKNGRAERDEQAVIANKGSSAVNLQGWHLNADDQGQDFYFPSFDLQPGQTCRVYTNERHANDCGGTFGSRQAVWANKGECGHLFDAGGNEVSTYCYHGK